MIRLALIAVLLAAGVTCAKAESELIKDFDDAVAEAFLARQAGDKESEIVNLEKALRVADSRTSFPDSKLTTVLERLYDLYEGGNPRTSDSRRREDVKVSRRLLAFHRAKPQPDPSRIEKYCFALYWMESVLREPEQSLEHIQCYLESVRRTRGEDHLDTAHAWEWTAKTLFGLRRDAEAEEAFLRAASIFGDGRRDTFGAAGVWSGYSSVLGALGRYDEQEAAMQKSIAIIERAPNVDLEQLAFQQGGLVTFYNRWGRHAEADAIVWRAYLALNSRDPTSFTTGLFAWRAGGASLRARQFADARRLFQQALQVHRMHMSEKYVQLGSIQLSLAQVYEAEGNRAAALDQIAEAMTFWRKWGWENSPEFAQAMLYSGKLRLELGQFSLARDLLQGARDGFIGTGDLDSQAVWATFRLAQAEAGLGESARALELLKEAITDVKVGVTAGDRLRLDAALARSSYRPIVAEFLRRCAIAECGDVGTTFEAAQIANTTDTAATLIKTAARYAVGNAQQAALLRERSELTRRWRKLESDLAKASSQEANELRNTRSQLDSRLRAVNGEIQSSPAFASGATSAPTSISEVKALLDPHEALIAYHFDEHGAYAWVVTGASARFVPLANDARAIGANVARVRASLQIRDGFALPFDLRASYQLFQQTLLPLMADLHHVSLIHVVPSGPLRGVPLAVLITREPMADGQYQRQPWAARQFAFSNLPSVGSFKALRSTRVMPNRPRAFLGVGDPLLSGAAAANTRLNARDLVRGGQVRVEAIRQLPRISDTAAEMKDMAKALGADPSDVLLGAEATKRNLRSKPLGDYEVIAFATHGLVNGELEGVTEPALVLTPPSTAGNGLDSLLAASEIAELNLNADWVILSACNTSAPDGSPAGEYLSGLAKAFFHAGARAVLVSHWYVSSYATLLLTTNSVRLHKSGLSKAHALRAAMLSLLDDPPQTAFGHPAYWAPFVLVGDGGR